ncbi:reverse transcriptase [Trichonephila clavipes]|nr:reverse transcriptase [Trichonephila clavipes]
MLYLKRDDSVSYLRAHWPWERAPPTTIVSTIQCRTKIAELISYGWTVVLQWVPSHVGLLGNERADQKVKQGVESTQPEVPLTLRRANSIIFTHIDKYTAITSHGKPWETLATVDPISRHLERAETVACFHLTTGYDFLGVYLHWLRVAVNEDSPLCGHARMADNHLPQCTGLDEYSADDIISRLWEARRQMVKKPSSGNG